MHRLKKLLLFLNVFLLGSLEMGALEPSASLLGYNVIHERKNSGSNDVELLTNFDRLQLKHFFDIFKTMYQFTQSQLLLSRFKF